jgi:hypothetical protein
VSGLALTVPVGQKRKGWEDPAPFSSKPELLQIAALISATFFPDLQHAQAFCLWARSPCSLTYISLEITEMRPANQFDKGDDGCKHDYQRDGAQVKLKNKSQHPDEHEKHESCPKHQ